MNHAGNQTKPVGTRGPWELGAEPPCAAAMAYLHQCFLLPPPLFQRRKIRVSWRR